MAVTNSSYCFVRAFVISSRVGQFVRAYETRFNATPNFLAAQGFDAATLIVAAAIPPNHTSHVAESST